MASQGKLIVIGASQGGITALQTILGNLSGAKIPPVLIVLHQANEGINQLPTLLQQGCVLPIIEGQSRHQLMASTIYLAPPGYHTLIEQDMTISLSLDPPVHHSIPSIDVLFESAADALGPKLLGILLTGNSRDGTVGIQRIKNFGGLTIVQNPKTATAQAMPQSAISNCDIDHIVDLEEIGPLMESFGG